MCQPFSPRSTSNSVKKIKKRAKKQKKHPKPAAPQPPARGRPGAARWRGRPSRAAHCDVPYGGVQSAASPSAPTWVPRAAIGCLSSEAARAAGPAQRRARSGGGGAGRVLRGCPSPRAAAAPSGGSRPRGAPPRHRDPSATPTPRISSSSPRPPQAQHGPRSPGAAAAAVPELNREPGGAERSGRCRRSDVYGLLPLLLLSSMAVVLRR